MAAKICGLGTEKANCNNQCVRYILGSGKCAHQYDSWPIDKVPGLKAALNDKTKVWPIIGKNLE